MINAARPPAHPLSAFGLDMLARGAARLRGGRLALAEYGAGAKDKPAPYVDLDRLAAAFAARARSCGLRPNEAILILGANRIGVYVAVLGALAAGLEPVLAPAHATADELAIVAQHTAAAALFGPSSYGEADCEGLLFEAAARAPDTRFVAALTRGSTDAVDFSCTALMEETALGAPTHAKTRIGLVRLGADGPPRIDMAPQSELIAEGLDLVSRLELSSDTPILCTLSPASRAGLVAGAFAALLSGAPLHVLGPFSGEAFAALAGALGRYHLAAPAESIADFSEAGALRGALGLALSGPQTFLPPHGFERPIARLAAPA